MVSENLKIEISSAPKEMQNDLYRIFTKEAQEFLFKLASEFQPRVDKLLKSRKLCKLELELSGQLPNFPASSFSEEEWKISPLPERLCNRQLDLGDVSPSNDNLLKNALSSTVQGIQVDFDDGNCPSWANQIKGIHNVIKIVNGEFCKDLPELEKCPVLILRPRAWNMNEHNVVVSGKQMAGPLVDFGMLMFHVGKKLYEKGSGPYFYLPKLENSSEAKLWDDIFTWTETQVQLSHGSIKACVLIENILAAFHAENILYELRHHSFGLNCGIWDYSASIINIFGSRKDFIIPDRNKYVNLDQAFLSNYISLVISVCKRHSAPVTGGMIASILSERSPEEKNKILVNIIKAKRREIHMGVSGFLTYDLETVPFLQASTLFNDQDLSVPTKDPSITNMNLLTIPNDGVTFEGLVKNVQVGIIFIYSWISEARGHFILNGTVEDSATAEISRSQVWQWIYHEVHLEDDSKEQITKPLVTQMAWRIYAELINCQAKVAYNPEHLQLACEIFLDLISAHEFPEFMTTYLYNHSTFRKLQNT